MWYDALMAVILLYTTFRGRAKGIAWQLAGIAALVLCFLFATPLSLVVAPWIKVDPPLNRWLAMLAIYLAFSFGCFGIARALRGWLEEAKFEEFDKHLGALFGLVKGATICLVLTFFVVCLSEAACHYVLRSYSGQIAGKIFRKLDAVMPAELAHVLDRYLHHVDEHGPQFAGDDDAHDDFDEAGERLSHRDEERDGFRGSSRRRDDIFRDDDLETDRDSRHGRSRENEMDDDDRDREDSEKSSESKGLLDKLSGAITEKIKEGLSDAVEKVLPGENSSSEKPAKSSKPARSERGDRGNTSDLLSEVSRILGGSREQQSRREELEALLNGIPDSVAAAALADWRADLRGMNPDPDPDTDLTTPLDVRLWRQLESAGVSLDDLPRPLRSRLQNSAP